MRITWGSILTAGITASVAVVLFLIVVPQLLGMGAIDLAGDLGAAFGTQSPHIAGGIFLAIIGTIWATVFAVLYSRIPGNYLTKGTLFGIVVGIFTLMIQPNLMTTLNGMLGTSGEVLAADMGVNSQAAIMLLGYVFFGLTLSWSYRPAESL